MKNVGIIGVGKMGGAIAKGLEGKKFALKILDRHPVEIAAAEQVDSYLKLANCDAVLLCVKPGDLQEAAVGFYDAMRQAGKHPLVISIAAGKTVSFLEGSLPGERVVRAMPNLAASVGKSVTCFSSGKLATREDAALAREIFDCFGTSMQLEESELDAASVLCGSGPAFFFHFAQKLSNAGVSMGLDAETADFLARQVLVGAGRIAESSEESMADLMRKVATPKGFTEAALQSLESSGFEDAIAKATATAKEKCTKIGVK